MILDRFRKLSDAPTNPKSAPLPRSFDVADLYRGPIRDDRAAYLQALGAEVLTGDHASLA